MSGWFSVSKSNSNTKKPLWPARSGWWLGVGCCALLFCGLLQGQEAAGPGDQPAEVVFQLGPLAPRPELGHVDTEPGPTGAEATAPGSAR